MLVNRRLLVIRFGRIKSYTQICHFVGGWQFKGQLCLQSKNLKTPLHVLLLLLWKNPKTLILEKGKGPNHHPGKGGIRNKIFCIFFCLNFFSHNFRICKKPVPSSRGKGGVEPSPILTVPARITIGRTSLAVQRPRLQAWASGSIPSQGTRSHMPQDPVKTNK